MLLLRRLSRKLRSLALVWSLLPPLPLLSDDIIRHAIDLRKLQPEQAEKGLPVELQGTVVFLESPNGSVLIQDSSAGTFFRGPRENDLKIGDQLEVKGVSTPGLYLPGIEKSSYKKLGSDNPIQAKPASYADLLSGRYHYELISVEGIVQAITPEEREGQTKLILGIDQDLLEVRVYEPPVASLNLVDSKIRLTGIAAGFINSHRQLVKPMVWVQEWKNLIQLTPPKKISEISLTSISKLLGFEIKGSSGNRVKIKGQVLATFPGGIAYLRDEAHALRLQTSESLALSEGQEIIAVGFPKMLPTGVSLENVSITPQDTKKVPLPIPVTMEELLNGRYNQNLVNLQGELSGVFRTEIGYTLMLQDQHRNLRVHLPSLSHEPSIGSRVSVTGISQMDQNFTSGLLSKPSHVSILCRSEKDLNIVHQPSWWTSTRLAKIAATLSLLVILAALWIALLKRKVQRYTEALKTKIQLQAMHEERQRIARDFHDTLEQGLTGLSLRLDTLKARGAEPKSLKLLESSHALVSQIHAETRGIIADLRESTTDSSDLVEALTQMVEEYALQETPRIQLTVESLPPKLPARTVHHLKMVVREAITNALKHAEAKHILITLSTHAENLKLSIQDDGKGFDTSQIHTGYHYGRIGIEERCEKLGGKAQWHSSQEHGTRVEITLPHPIP